MFKRVNLLANALHRKNNISFSFGKSITLDPMLLTIPKDLGEFVIVHELVHLLTPTHGKLFKLFMHAYLPDWEERKRKLQEYAGAERS